jgi:hypothetical protein
LDDELAQLLSSANQEEKVEVEKIEKVNKLKNEDVNLDELEGLINEEDNSIPELSKNELASMINFEEDFGLNNIQSDYDEKELFQEEKVQEEKEEKESAFMEMENMTVEESIQGDDMSSDFSELDSLNEQDVLSALSNIDSPITTITNDSSNQKVEVESSNVNDIAELISKLLNNKTLEITIKIKD